MMGSLTQRVFLMRNVHDDAPVLLKSRWALSYLRGPLTPAEISRLMAPRKTAANSPPPQVLPRDTTPQAAAAATAPAHRRAPGAAGGSRGTLPARARRGGSHHLPAARAGRGETAFRRQARWAWTNG